jgi:hypothetical protein
MTDQAAPVGVAPAAQPQLPFTSTGASSGGGDAPAPRTASEWLLNRTPTSTQPQPSTDPVSGNEPPQPPATVRVGEYELSEGDLRDLASHKAAQDLRKLLVPADPNGYKIETSKDFKPPQGVEFSFHPDDPLFVQARATAHEMGLSQDQFSKLLDLYAGSEIAKIEMLRAERDRHIQALGPNAKVRLDAIERYYSAMLGRDDAAIRMQRVLTADDVRIAEKEILRAQGTGSFPSPQHRTPPPESGRVSEESYQRMTTAERMDYARRFSNGGGR